MTKHVPFPLDWAFVPKGTPTFQDLIDNISTQGTLFPTRQRDMISGLNRVAKALGLPPSEVPCDGRWLQPRLSKVSPPLLGIKPKTWQNAVSDVRAAMAAHGIVERRFRRESDLSLPWQELWRKIRAMDDPTLPTALVRFVHFLNRCDVQPQEVCNENALSYREALAVNEISKDPENSYRTAVNGWNLAIRRVPGWPAAPLTLPSRQKVIQLPPDTFPQSFLDSLENYLSNAASLDPLSDRGRRRVLRPATLKQYRRQILRFASELVRSGIDPSTIISLEALLDPEIVKRGLQQMLKRNDNETSRSISETAGLLRSMANSLERPEEQRKRLIEFAGKVAVRPQKGMTAKNRTLIRVLQEPANRLRLLQLPDRVFSRPAGKQKPYAAALAREEALAISILLVCPIRVGSLARIELERHLQRPGDGRVFLVLEEADTKTGRSIEFELPTELIRQIDAHLATRVPHMCPAGTPYLFPQRSGERAVDASVLATRIAKRVRRETGLTVNAHLFRHFAVMIWLDANPGGYEFARRLLGHAELSHTINLYSGMEYRTASRAFSDLVDGLKRGAA